MAIPTNALVWAEPMDPYDVVDFTVDVTPLLDGDSLASYTVAPTAESLLLGLTVGSTGAYATSVSGNLIRVWLSIESTKQGSTSFDGAGVSLPLEISITTSSIPPRKRQRTVVVKVAQR